VKVACDAVMFNMGECCCAGTRTFVHENIYDEFVKKTVEYIKGKSVGDPFDMSTGLGPLVRSHNGHQRQRPV
jgi:acyl-CoA reductase-like NAD-dependent aldehyde dehydrogenase